MPHPTDEHVGVKIREARSSQGMSQEQLAAKLGVSFQQVQKYEKGTNRVGSSRLWAMCQALEVPVNFFFDDLKESLNGKPYRVLSAKSLQCARELDQIEDENVRNHVYRLIRAIREDFSKAG